MLTVRSRVRLGARLRPRRILPRAVAVGLAAGLGSLALVAAPKSAHAQVKVFHLDRLEMPGAPDDGMVLFRPVTQPKPIFFGQVGLGYSRNVLHTSNITSDKA